MSAEIGNKGTEELDNTLRQFLKLTGWLTDRVVKLEVENEHLSRDLLELSLSSQAKQEDEKPVKRDPYRVLVADDLQSLPDIAAVLKQAGFEQHLCLAVLKTMQLGGSKANVYLRRACSYIDKVTQLLDKGEELLD